MADEEVRDHLRSQLKAFNDQVSPHHRAIRAVDPRPLDITIRDPTGEIVGGLVASTYWDWLDIDTLWVSEQVRGKGYGEELRRRSEEEARRRGCRRAKLTTFGFQARGFYEKMGYRVTGELADYPHGGCFYWMRKEL